MRTKPVQLSVMAVAALAVFAVAAVMLLSGGNPAQATTAATIAPDSGAYGPLQQKDGETPRPTPRTHATPEPCPGQPRNLKTLDHVVDSGQIALFDVYWNPVERELTNTSCPPTVVHVPESENEDGETIRARDDRSASSINIAETVIHIPNSARIDLSTSTTYTETKYPELWAADKLENRDTDGDGTLDGVGDGIVWALPACPDSPATTPLCLSFSTALLDDDGADWVDLTVDNEGNVSGGIEYHIDHVHQIDVDRQDPRYTLAYDPGVTGANAALWDSSDARIAVMPVAVGEYERPIWFFTDRGTYELQVHIRGMPQHDPAELGGLPPLGTEDSVTSDMREYTIHVGAEADLSVSVTVEEAATGTAPLEPGDNVTITVTAASNAGSEKAPDTKVDVSLPSGLVPPVDGQPYPSQATKGTYADGVWTIGSMCNPTVPAKPTSTPPEPECPQGATLTITAKVAAETYGQELAVKATISATETLVITESEDGQKVAKTYNVPVLDTAPDNDMATGTVTVATLTNMDPMFMIKRSVNENANAGTTVGDPVEASDPNIRDRLLLTYSLMDYRSGNSADKFTVSRNAEGDAQIATAAVLNYEDDKHHYVKLCVSDGKSEQGTDPSIDHCILVYIQVVDNTSEVLKVTLSADATSKAVNEHVNLTGTISNSPVETAALQCQWAEENVPTTGDDQSGRAYPPFEKQVTYGQAAQREYTLGCQYHDDGQVVFREASVTVNWTS
ncbi:MAG: cadherin repeat domain-containing protein [Chloroflexi bacterium]|nr:cadherin repeat domain-containing protein [Chloroflexota bacterium]